MILGIGSLQILEITKLAEKLRASGATGVVLDSKEVEMIVSSLELLATEKEKEFCLAMKAEEEMTYFTDS